MATNLWLVWVMTCSSVYCVVLKVAHFKLSEATKPLLDATVDFKFYP